jgi:hypothetical protein
MVSLPATGWTFVRALHEEFHCSRSRKLNYRGFLLSHPALPAPQPFSFDAAWSLLLTPVDTMVTDKEAFINSPLWKTRVTAEGDEYETTGRDGIDGFCFTIYPEKNGISVKSRSLKTGYQKNPMTRYGTRAEAKIAAWNLLQHRKGFLD